MCVPNGTPLLFHSVIIGLFSHFLGYVMGLWFRWLLHSFTGLFLQHLLLAVTVQLDES